MNDFVKKANAISSYSAEQIYDMDMCEQDPFYFIDKFMKVQHPTKGSLPLKLYPFQVKIIEGFHTHSKTVLIAARQCGKTTSASAYLLWRAMFREGTKILIAANKLKSALEVMTRVKYAYEECPDHIKAGVKKFNEGTIVFDNGSVIEAVATTADAARGKSLSLLYIDEMSFIQNNIATEFWTSVQPTLSTGGECIVTSTPRNDTDQFAQIWKGSQVLVDEFGNLTGSEVGENGFFGISVPWWEHPELDEEWAKPFRASLGEARFKQEFCCLGGETTVEISDGFGIVRTVELSTLYREMALWNNTTVQPN